MSGMPGSMSGRVRVCRVECRVDVWYAGKNAG